MSTSAQALSQSSASTQAPRISMTCNTTAQWSPTSNIPDLALLASTLSRLSNLNSGYKEEDDTSTLGTESSDGERPQFTGVNLIHIPVGHTLDEGQEQVEEGLVNFPVRYKNGKIRMFSTHPSTDPDLNHIAPLLDDEGKQVEVEGLFDPSAYAESYDLVELDVSTLGMAMVYSLWEASALPDLNSTAMFDEQIRPQAAFLLRMYREKPKALSIFDSSNFNAHISEEDCQAIMNRIYAHGNVCTVLLPWLQPEFIRLWSFENYKVPGSEEAGEDVAEAVDICDDGLRFAICDAALHSLAFIITDGVLDKLADRNDRDERMKAFVRNICREDVDMVFHVLKGPKTVEFFGVEFFGDGELLAGEGRKLVVALARLADCLLLFSLGHSSGELSRYNHWVYDCFPHILTGFGLCQKKEEDEGEEVRGRNR